MRRTLILDDWLLAESVRTAEERLGRRADAAAIAIATDRGGSLSERIRHRASALDLAPALRADIVRLRRALGWLSIALAVLGCLLGAVAARATIAESQVDVLLAAAALLLVPTVMLLAWCVAMALSARRSGSTGVLSALVMTLLRWLGPRLLASPQAADAMTAFAGAAPTAWGRWRLSAITHAFWLAYAAGALLTLFVFFSVAQYDLTWGTTLLTDRTVVGLVEWLSGWPATLGFMPEADPAWIVAGREGVADPSARAEWARFLLAMIAAWAIVPRCALALISLGLAVFASRRMPLDTTRPGYLRLAADLSPPPPDAGADSRPLPETECRKRRRRRPDASDILAVAVELEREADEPAKLVPGMEVIDLGRADHRAGRRAALEAAEALGHPAAAVLGVCSMLRTPDAGTERFLARLADAASAPLWLVLDEGERLAMRNGDVAARRRDWMALAERAGADVVFYDRDAPDAAQLARLHRAVRDGGDTT